MSLCIVIAHRVLRPLKDLGFLVHFRSVGNVHPFLLGLLPLQRESACVPLSIR